MKELFEVDFELWCEKIGGVKTSIKKIEFSLFKTKTRTQMVST